MVVRTADSHTSLLTGKSSLVARYCDGPTQEIEAYHPTIEQTKKKEVEACGRKWDLTLVDTAGQVRCSSPLVSFPAPTPLSPSLVPLTSPLCYHYGPYRHLPLGLRYSSFGVCSK